MPSPQSKLSDREEELLQRFLVLRGKAREAEFITVTDAAEMIGYSHYAILKWINEGKVEAVRVGGRFWIWRATLNEHLREQNTRILFWQARKNAWLATRVRRFALIG